MKEKSAIIKDRVLQLIENQNIKKADFFRRTGIADSAFRGAIRSKDLSLSAVVRILNEFPNLSPDWLLLGEGSMIRSTEIVHDPPPKEKNNNVEIPLISIKASEGFDSGTITNHIHEIKEYYLIPKFENRAVEFLFEVEGLAMSPNFNPGDIVGCKLESDLTRIKWNEPYLISTTEGELLIKRIKPGTKLAYLLVSDNKEYEPYEIPTKEIKGLALVLGTIK